MGINGASVGTPGSNRSADPAGIARRIPYAAARSNMSRGLTSKKWKWDVMLTGTSEVLVATRYTRPAGVIDSWAAVITAPGASGPRLPPSPNGSRTTTMRVPSSNTASTLTSRTMSGTPGRTSSTPSTAAPAAAACIRRAPSRAASHTVSAMIAVASGTLSLKPRARRALANSAAVKMSNRSRSVGVRRMAPRYSRLDTFLVR